jgi:glycolate oxidase FAD binding subunit
MITDTLTPVSAEDLADALRDASAVDRPVVPWGAGTLQRLGAAPPPGALALHTTALDRLLEYNPSDLTVTVDAGITLDALQAALTRHGQWLPWNPPSPGEATIGGLLAAGASGPLRLGYGSPRDWALGMRVALADGRLVKSGGKVVKNVAGYEAHKLHIGALGTLGVIVEVTLKVFPMPERVGALLIACATRADALGLAERLHARPLAPIALTLIAGGAIDLFAEYAPGARSQSFLAARFDGAPATVERQLRTARGAAESLGALVFDLSDEQERAVWRGLAAFAALAPMNDASALPAHTHGSGVGRDGGLLLRVGARPSALPALLDALERHAPVGAIPQIIGWGGVGLAWARWPLPDSADGAEVARAVAGLRAALAAEDGYVVIEDAPDDLRPGLDLWGAPPATLPLMRALKAQWDPRGILNPGRYVGGL